MFHAAESVFVTLLCNLLHGRKLLKTNCKAPNLGFPFEALTAYKLLIPVLRAFRGFHRTVLYCLDILDLTLNLVSTFWSELMLLYM